MQITFAGASVSGTSSSPRKYGFGIKTGVLDHAATPLFFAPRTCAMAHDISDHTMRTKSTISITMRQTSPSPPSCPSPHHMLNLLKRMHKNQTGRKTPKRWVRQGGTTTTSTSTTTTTPSGASVLVGRRSSARSFGKQKQ